MTKSTKKAPSTTGADSVSSGSRSKNTKEHKPMNSTTKPLFGVVYLSLRVSFIIAGITLIKMPFVHFIFDIPLYQIVGGIIFAFLIWLELYAYFAKPTEAKSKAKKSEPQTPLQKFQQDFIQT